jgi:hypothetical protein
VTRPAAESLDEAAAALLERLERESQRDAASGTERAGGVTRIGGRLEAFLRAALLEAAAIDSRDPLAAVRSVLVQADSVERVTLGTLAKVLEKWSGSAEDHAALRPILEDLRSKKRSLLWRVINYRNDIAHDRKDADGAAAIATELAVWLRHYRTP